MILDPNGIAAATGEISVATSHTHGDDAEAKHSRSDDQSALLVFRAGGKTGPKAVPLALVAAAAVPTTCKTPNTSSPKSKSGATPSPEQLDRKLARKNMRGSDDDGGR